MHGTTTALGRRLRGLYVLADARHHAFAPGKIEAVLRGGACAIQYRDKYREASSADVVRARALCREYQVPFIVNDDPQLARALAADGVHLGRDDPGVAQARALLGPDALIGVSCYDDLSRARQAAAAGADYVAFGRFFPSATKPEARPCPLSLIVAARPELAVAVVAIGGITPQNGGLLVSAGADALAVAAGVFAAPSIEDAMRHYMALFQET
ncbi:MAG: thiamine phosphate synthase [Acidiferrobacteraceae bacterium]